MNNTAIFTYGSVAHGFMVLVYLLFSAKLTNFRKTKIFTKETFLAFLYLVGHIFLFTAMVLRIQKSGRKKKSTSILGTIGHSLLLLFFLNFVLIMNKAEKFKITLNKIRWLNILCIIGQIGMICIYWDEYNYRNKSLPKIKKYIHILAFILLLIFYSLIAFKPINKNTVFFYASLGISILYLLFIFREIM